MIIAWACATWTFERRPQRTRRNDAPIADAAAAVDDEYSQVFDEGRVLKSVVHHDDAGAAHPRGLRALEAVARDDGRREPRQQQRLVTDLGGGMDRRVDPHRAAQASAIAAAEKVGVRVRGQKEPRYRESRRRLAGAADREVAEADDRNADAAAGRIHPPRRDRAVDAGEGAKETAASRLPPKRRLAHYDARCSSRSCNR